MDTISNNFGHQNHRRRGASTILRILAIILLLIVVVVAGYFGMSWYVQNRMMLPHVLPYGETAITLTVRPSGISGIEQINYTTFDKNGQSNWSATCYIETHKSLTLKSEIVQVPSWTSSFGGYSGIKTIEIDGCSSSPTTARNIITSPIPVNLSDGSDNLQQTTFKIVEGSQTINAETASCGLVVNVPYQGSCP
jgi:hypothetical protein